MNTTRRDLIMQRWNVVQHELLPELRNEVGTLTPKLEKVIHTLACVHIEAIVSLRNQCIYRYKTGIELNHDEYNIKLTARSRSDH